jgi:hypothetical protein
MLSTGMDDQSLEFPSLCDNTDDLMWSGRNLRNGAVKAVAEAVRPSRIPATVRPCRRCLSYGVRRGAIRSVPLRFDHSVSPRHSHLSRASSSSAPQEEYEEFVSQAEADQAKLLDSARQKVDEYNNALSEVKSLNLRAAELRRRLART